MAIVFLFFLKKFFEGFLIGCIIRILIALFTKTDFTVKGLCMSGLVGGIMVDALNYYFLITTNF